MTTTEWTQIYFGDFLSNLGGLFTSVMGGATFLISGYQQFSSMLFMIKNHYGEETTGLAEDNAAPSADNPKR